MPTAFIGLDETPGIDIDMGTAIGDAVCDGNACAFPALLPLAFLSIDVLAVAEPGLAWSGVIGWEDEVGPIDDEPTWCSCAGDTDGSVECSVGGSAGAGAGADGDGDATRVRTGCTGVCCGVVRDRSVGALGITGVATGTATGTLGEGAKPVG